MDLCMSMNIKIEIVKCETLNFNMQIKIASFLKNVFEITFNVNIKSYVESVHNFQRDLKATIKINDQGVDWILSKLLN